jgi:hypothetical protein
MKNRKGKQTQPMNPGKTTQREKTMGTAEPNRVDVTGIMPEDIRIDPDIIEGHPGYEESGDSEIIPRERLAKGETARRVDKSR